MKNLNKRTEFDRQWEDIFKEAEMAPSDGIWNKIDSALSRDEAGYFKKRAFLFKLLAAASIAFALGVGIFSINYYLGQNTDQLVIENNEAGNNRFLNETNSEIASTENIEAGQNERSTKEGNIIKDGTGQRGDNLINVFDEDDSKSDLVEINNYVSNNGSTQHNSANSNAVLSRETYRSDKIESLGVASVSNDEMLYTLDHIYLIPIIPKGASKQKNANEGGLFLASVDFSTGVFNPNFQQGGSILSSTPSSLMYGARAESVNDQLASFNATNKDFLLVRSAGQETKPEVSFSYGANVGFKLSRRFVVQTGIAYRKANTTTTTTGYLEDATTNTRIPIVASHQYQLNGLSSVNRIEETDLRNQYEFASIPLRAGYVLLDKKFNVTLLAGVSSEFFLNNQIVDKSNYLETLSSSSSEGSPYKSVYFNGTLGTMLGYSFADNYLISIEPSYRFAVNSFTRDDFYLNSYPSSFMVSFGVAYNFK